MALTRRTLTLAGLALAIVAPGRTAHAFAQPKPFDAKAFAAAQAAGQTILVEISAPWCPTCKVQKPILARLGAKPEFAKFAFFEIDFDSQKEALRQMRAQSQSTLIVFKGAQETGRSVGDTNAASIEALLKKGV